MSNSAYDIYLGDKSNPRGYRLRSFVRDSAPQIAPRFSTGSQGQTDLDLLKSVSLDSVAGGMFQREFTDPQKVARGVGFFNKYDENLYPSVPPSSALTGGFNSGYFPILKAESENYTFVMAGSFGAGTWYNALRMVTKSSPNTVVSISLPAALASNIYSYATGMCLHKNSLFVLTQTPSGTGVGHYRYDIDAGTWSGDLGVGSGVIVASMRGLLYGINVNSTIYSITNEMAATVVTTALDTVGYSSPTSQPIDMKEFNGALWISKPDGIYRFDGVKAIKVLNLVTSFMQVFNGAIYFVAGDWLYRFDGTNVFRLQFFGNQEKVSPLGLSANSDYLFVQTSSLTSSYTGGDKANTATASRRIYSYDGAAWLLLSDTSVTLGSSYVFALAYCANKLFDFWADYVVAAYDNYYYRYDLDNRFLPSAVTSAFPLEVTLSEFDDGFPNIFKSLELLDLNYAGMISGDSLVVKYQIYDGKNWGSWITAGTLTSTSANQLEITDYSNKLFKRVKVNITATLAAGSTLRFKGASLRYTLQPRSRWRWQVGIMAEGNSTTFDKNNNAITDDSNALNNYITQTIKQKTPSFMLAPDYGIVKTGINNVALSFIIKGQVPMYADPYNEYQLCAVKNNSGVWELLRVSGVSYNSGADETTITVLERGYLGITAGTINANAEFHLAYKVYVNRLLRDATILDENTYNEQPSGESQLKRDFIIELIEV